MSVPAESVAALVAGSAAAAGLDLVSFILRKPRWLIDGVQGSVLNVMAAVREDHTDELEITKHPVEQGANIADHAFVKPAKVVLQWAWSDSPNAGQGPLGLGGVILAGSNGGQGYAKQIYDQLLALRDSRQPFTLMTGKRSYDDMLITLISVPTSWETENVLMATLHCEKVLIVKTEQTTVEADPDILADPPAALPTINTGGKNLLPVAEPTPNLPGLIDFNAGPFTFNPNAP